MEVPKTTERTTCRICESPKLTPLFSLGDQYISDFVDKDKIHSGIKAPISLVRCEECTLVQMKHTAPQELLYSGHYWYRSGVTETMREALRDVAEAAMREVNLEPGDVVLDIGSNDGTLLRSYDRDDVIKIGVEPAKNLQEVGKEGVDVLIQDFWSYELYVQA